MKTILIPFCFFAFATPYAQTDTVRSPEMKKTDSDIRIIQEEKLKIDTSADKTIRRSSETKVQTDTKLKTKEKAKDRDKTTSPNTNPKKSDTSREPIPQRR